MTGLAASIATILYTRKNLRTSKYIETITNERIKWIQSVRDEFSELISSILIHKTNDGYLNDLKDDKLLQNHTEHLAGAYMEHSEDDLREYTKVKSGITNIENAISKVLTRSEISYKAMLIKLKLNPNDDYEIIKDLDEIVSYFSDYSNGIAGFGVNLNLTTVEVQKLLKREWEKVKVEVQNK